jgi:hypothetical protein
MSAVLMESMEDSTLALARWTAAHAPKKNADEVRVPSCDYLGELLFFTDYLQAFLHHVIHRATIDISSWAFRRRRPQSRRGSDPCVVDYLCIGSFYMTSFITLSLDGCYCDKWVTLYTF